MAVTANRLQIGKVPHVKARYEPSYLPHPTSLAGKTAELCRRVFAQALERPVSSARGGRRFRIFDFDPSFGRTRDDFSSRQNLISAIMTMSPM